MGFRRSIMRVVVVISLVVPSLVVAKESQLIEVGGDRKKSTKTGKKGKSKKSDKGVIMELSPVKGQRRHKKDEESGEILLDGKPLVSEKTEGKVPRSEEEIHSGTEPALLIADEPDKAEPDKDEPNKVEPDKAEDSSEESPDSSEKKRFKRR